MSAEASFLRGPSTLAHWLVKKARRLGRRTLGHSRAAVSAAIIDRRMGLDTSGVISKRRLGTEGDETLHYEPSSWFALRRVLSPSEVSPDDVFLDIGSGKGRVLYQAASYPFKRVVGVEISEQLNDVARRNVERNRHRLQAPVEVHTADATQFEIPADVTVVYLYNPFIGSLFRNTVDNLVASVDHHPRTVRLITRALGHAEEDALNSTGRFRLVKEVPALRPTRTWARNAALRVYEVELT